MEPLPHERDHLVQHENIYAKSSAKQSTHVRTTALSDSSSGLDTQRDEECDWKPVVLRKGPLLLLFLVTAAIFSLLQYAAMHLPHGGFDMSAELEELDSRGLEEPVHIQLDRPVMLPRQGNITSTESSASSDYIPDSYTEPVTTPQPPATAPPSEYLPESLTQTIPAPPMVQSYTGPTPTAPQSTSQSESLTYTYFSPAPTDYIPAAGTYTQTFATPSSAYVPYTDGGEKRPQVIVYTWTPSKVFASTYLPLIVAVVYRLWWAEMHEKLALIDPFRHLSQPGGALASVTLFSAYQQRNSIQQPILALWRGRWILFSTGLANLAASFLPALASEALLVDTNWHCPHPDPHYPKNPCHARLASSVSVIRVLQGILIFGIGVVILLAFALYFKRTGLRDDPSSLASIATLMQDQALVSESVHRQVDLNDGPGAAFAGRRFCLGTWVDQTGRIRRGIQPMGPREVRERRSVAYSSRTVDLPNEKKSTVSRWRPFDALLAFLSLGTFAVILAYYLDGRKDNFNNFFNSNTFGPRFILTGSATVIANLWKSMEHDSMIMAPYTRLYTRASSYASTLAFSSTVTPLVSTWRAIRNRYWLAAAVTIIALLGETLNIVIAGVPYSPGLVWAQFLVSAYMSLAILALMLMTIVFVMFRRRREPKLPVKPTTLVAKMSYLAESEVLDDFVGGEWDGTNERDARLRRLNKNYRLEEVQMQDGARKWLITESGGRYI